MIKLRLKARAGLLCPHLEAHLGGARRYVGRTFDPNLGHTYLDENKNRLLTGGWPASKVGEEILISDEHVIEHTVEYARAVRSGDLWAADEDTAKLLGVDFDSKFGGEFDEEPEAPKPEVPRPTKSIAPSAKESV
jgi:hypothetical protein